MNPRWPFVEEGNQLRPGLPKMLNRQRRLGRAVRQFLKQRGLLISASIRVLVATSRFFQMLRKLFKTDLQILHRYVRHRRRVVQGFKLLFGEADFCATRSWCVPQTPSPL